jgi:hypothetical protein
MLSRYSTKLLGVLYARILYIKANVVVVSVCLSVQKPRSQIEIPNKFQKCQGLKKCPPEFEGPKTIQDLNVFVTGQGGQGGGPGEVSFLLKKSLEKTGGPAIKQKYNFF